MNSTILTAKAKPKLRRVRVYPRLTLDVRKRLTEYCARKGLTERDIIEEAIRQYLDGTGDSAKVLAQLERLALAIDAERERRDGAHREVHRAIEVLSEAFGRFLRLWMFVHAATFKQPATQEAAESMYEKFAAKIAEYFQRGHRFLHDLPNVDDKRTTQSVRKP
jgi:predicted DNA-binding protein